MAEELWQAAASFAEALRDTPKLRRYRRGFDLCPPDDDFRVRLSRLTGIYSMLRCAPMLLGVRLNQMPDTEQLLQDERDRAWLQDAVEAGTGFAVVIEYLRSRLPGYPSLRVPHLRAGSPHVQSDPFFVANFPWEPELRQLGLQLQSAPDMSVMGGEDDCGEQIGACLNALQLRPEWGRFADARSALSGTDFASLSTLGKGFAERVSDTSIDEAAGELLIDRFRYRTAVLKDVVASCSGAVAEYLTAFEALDELMAFLVSFMETLMTSDGLLEVTPYRMDVGAGPGLRSVVLATRGDAPLHNPGEVLQAQGPHPSMTGLVYPTAITHNWGRLDDPDASVMIARGKLANL